MVIISLSCGEKQIKSDDSILVRLEVLYKHEASLART